MTTDKWLDQRVVYAFIRQDVPMEVQVVQSNHASYQAGLAHAQLAFRRQKREVAPANLHPDPVEIEGIPFLTTVGMPDLAAMQRVCAKLDKAGYTYTPFIDDHYDFGMVGMVTEPMHLDVRNKPNGLMCNYRLWNPANNTHPDDAGMKWKGQLAKHMTVNLDDQCIETIKKLSPEGESIGFGGLMGGVRLVWNPDWRKA